jgi:hypothetical protein
MLLSFWMGYGFLTGLHIVGLFAIFFLNIVCLLALLRNIKDRPYEHWEA